MINFKLLNQWREIYETHFFIILVLGLAVQSKADELISGSFAKLGLNYAYLTHSAGKSRTESVHMALFVDYDYIFENGFGLGYGVIYGANTGNANKHYLLQGVEILLQLFLLNLLVSVYTGDTHYFYEPKNSTHRVFIQYSFGF